MFVRKRGVLMYLHEDKSVFKQIIQQVSEMSGSTEEFVEKDYYVTMFLHLLSEQVPEVVFKGGTSLSKCHKVIKRFSEDIDIAFCNIVSQGKRKKIKECITEIALELGMVIPNLEETRSRRDYNKYILQYESVIEGSGRIVLPQIVLETSYTAPAFPTVVLPVETIIEECFVKNALSDFLVTYGLASFEMQVQSLERTLADKIFAICDYYIQGKSTRYSRHLYDIHKLMSKVELNEEFHELVKAVRMARTSKENCLSAKDGVDVPKLIQAIIDESYFKSDYEGLTSKILYEQVEYDVVIDSLRKFWEMDLI